MPSRIEFTENTKRIIAGRAGYLCSFPGCDRPTIGPGVESSQVKLVGTAAHIYSAAAGGPRGQGNLAPDQINDAKNGLWLCATHGREIDANGGAGYPPRILLSYKGLREAQAKKSLDGFKSPFGWLRELAIEESQILVPRSKLVFGKATYVVGDNAAGKTALTEWLNGLSDPSFLYRWLDRKEVRLVYGAKIHDPEEHSIGVRLGAGRLRYFVDSVEAPFNPLPIAFVCPVRDLRLDRNEYDDLEWLCEILKTDKLVMHNLIREVGKHSWSTIHNLHFEEIESPAEGRTRKRLRLFGDVLKSLKNLALGQFSGGEFTRLLLELAIAKAEYQSVYVPTVVVVDFVWTIFDDYWTQHYVEALLSTELDFQSVFFSVSAPKGVNWMGWERVDLIGTERNVRIEQ